MPGESAGREEKHDIPFLLVESTLHQPVTKLYACRARGEVLGVMKVGDEQ